MFPKLKSDSKSFAFNHYGNIIQLLPNFSYLKTNKQKTTTTKRLVLYYPLAKPSFSPFQSHVPQKNGL